MSLKPEPHFALSNTNFTGDEARYALAYMRWRLRKVGGRHTRPDKRYWNVADRPERVEYIEAEMDRYLRAARLLDLAA